MARIIGTFGSDNLTGTSEKDTIYGLSGNDTLDGKGNVDKLYAGNGDDTLIFNVNENITNSSNDLYDGGRNTDTLKMVINLNNTTEANQLINIQNAFYNTSSSRTLNLANYTNNVVKLSVVNTEKLDYSLNATTTEDQSFNISAASSSDRIVINYNGTADISSNNGIITYNPSSAFNSLAAGEQAQDSFTYTVYKGTTSNVVSTATVNFIITGENDAPTAQNVNVTTPEDNSAITANFLAIDPDTSNTLTYNIVSQPTEGSVTNNDNGTFTFNLGDNFQYLSAGESKIINFNYTVTDSEGVTSAPATVQVTVTGANDLPTISNLSVITGEVTEDAINQQATGRVIAVDVDAQDTPIWNPATDVQGSYGTLSIDANGNWTYNLDSSNPAVQAISAGDQCIDTFTVTGTSGTDAIAQNIYIYVNGSNDSPTAISPSIFATTANSTLNLSAQQLATDVDVNDTLQVTNIDTSGTLGNVSINADGTISYTPGNAFVSLNGSQSAVDSFTCTVTDNHGETTTSQVVVNVAGVNDAPVALPDANFVMTEYQRPLTIPVEQLLGNDYDPDSGDTFTLTSVSNVSAKGSAVSLSADGSSVLFTSNFYAFNALETGESDTDTFTYTVTDSQGLSSTGTVTVTIEGTSTPPDAYSRTYTIAEDAPSGTVVNSFLLASDNEDKYTLNFSIEHGNTDDAFAIAGRNIIVNNSSAIDFETNPVFNLTIKTTDSSGMTDTSMITVNVASSNSNIIYVDQDANGSADGSSWDNAYTNLQDALANANTGQQIWVASGTYTPIDGIAQENLPADVTASSFQMVNGVHIYGGFAGNETSILERNVADNPTILSGNIGDIDSSTDNISCVVKAASNSILDGFTITDAYSTTTASAYGALSCSGINNFTLANSTFTDNHAINGAAINIGPTSSDINIVNSMFVDNTATGMGGAINTTGQNVTITNSVFADNSAINSGGAIKCADMLSSTQIINSTFTGNYSASGGAIANYGNLDLTNSILWGNSGINGSELNVYQLGSNSTIVNIDSCDISGGLSSSTIYNTGGTINDNGNNLNVNPSFIDTSDPLNHGLALQAISPLIDAGNEAANTTGIDILGNARICDVPPITSESSVIDIGAYEYNVIY